MALTELQPQIEKQLQVQWGQHKNVVFLVSSHDGNKKNGQFPKNAVFWPEINFLWTAPKEIVAIMTGHLKDNLFVLTALQGGLRRP